jgi:hypothetical protein
VSYGGSKCWLSIQDEYPSYIWSYFLAAKSELSDTVINFLKKIQKDHNLKVKFMRLDKSGENKALRKKGFRFSLNLLYLTLHNKMVKLSENLQHYGKKCVLNSTVQNYLGA